MTLDTVELAAIEAFNERVAICSLQKDIDSMRRVRVEARNYCLIHFGIDVKELKQHLDIR